MITLISIILALFVSSSTANAQMVRIPAGGSEEINRHNVCRIVSNDNVADVMIPTNTAAEWSVGQNAFLAANRPGMRVQTCGRTTPTPSYIANFSCPNPYNRMFCGSTYTNGFMSDDGRLIFAFENGDSGLTAPKVHIFRNVNGAVSLITTVTGFAGYPTPTAAIAITPSGSHFAVWERRFTGNAGYNPRIRMYSFDGAIATEVASIATGAGTRFDAYTSFSMSNDARFVMADTWVFERVGSALVRRAITGPALTMTNNTASYDQMAIWSEPNGGFIEMDIETGIYLTKQDVGGNWVRTLIYSPGAPMYHVSMDVSGDGKKIALLHRDTFTAPNQVIDLLQKSGDAFSRLVRFTVPNQSLYYIHSDVEFSSVTGKILMVEFGRNIQQFDTSNLASGTAPPLPSLVLAAQMDNVNARNMQETSSGYMIFSNPLANSARGLFELWYAPN